MKIIFLIFVFWANASIEGIPKNYEYQQWMQSRSVSDWIYGNNPEQIQPNEIIDEKQYEVVPIDETETNDKPEPIENFIDELKEKAKETDNKDANTMHLLTDLNKTLTETPTKLAKVLVNKVWRIFDIGALGTTRRTRNVQEVSSILAPFYAFVGLLSQLFHGMQVGNQGNTSQTGSLFDLLFPLSYLTNALYGSPAVHQKLLQGISNSQPGHIHDTSNDSNVNYVFVINNKNKAEANRLLNGKTPNEVLSQVKHYLDKNDLDAEEKFYIVWKLYDLFYDLSENDDETNLKLIKLITRIGEDPRFEELFKALKEKDDPEFKKIWKLFKNSRPKLNKNYLSIIKNLPQRKISQHPSQNCFIIGLSQGNGKINRRKSGFESDDESHKLTARDLESTDDYRICCIDDDNESKANCFLGDGSNDEVVSKIEKHCNKEDLDPEYEWYIVLKLYKMLKNVNNDDKDKTRIIPMFAKIGKDPKFDKLFENIKTKNDPRFQEIWKSFHADPKQLEEIIKSSPKKETEKKEPEQKETDKKDAEKKESEKKDDSRIDNSQNPPLKKPTDDRAPKDEKEPKKDIVNIKTAEPLRTQETGKVELPSLSNPSKAGTADFKNLEPHHMLSWFHDSALERNARMIKNKVKYYSTKGDVSYSDLEEVENLLKDPSLDADSRQDLITFVNKWYGTFVRNEHVKHKFDELVHLIRINPEYNNFFETLNPGREEPRDDNELKALLKPPGTATPDPKENKPHNIESRLQDLARERKIRAMKDKVRQHSSRNEISYEDLEEVENLLKDPLLDLDSKYDLITFVHKWYGTFVRNDKMKNKFDEIVYLIKEDPEHNKFFETLNPARKETPVVPTNETKEPLKSPVEQLNNAGASLDNFLKNAEITLKNPSLDFQNRINLIKVIFSWQKFDKLDVKVKNKIDEFIKTLKENPENHKILETLKQVL